MTEEKKENGSENKEEQEEKKIIHDSDWKEKARKEKEKLAEEIKNQTHTNLPEASFTTHIMQLATQALILLGEIENPATNEKIENLPEAKFVIDTLHMLEEKTASNLDESEQQILGSLLYDLRMKFVDKSNATPNN